jgi:hypothetical protein
MSPGHSDRPERMRPRNPPCGETGHFQNVCVVIRDKNSFLFFHGIGDYKILFIAIRVEYTPMFPDNASRFALCGVKYLHNFCTINPD